jgi:hypothetical protein
MNCVMAGMIPVMVILRTDIAGTTDVGSVRFWVLLSLAVFAGLVAAYPVNVWLVSSHLKHGMGTVRALGEGGEPLRRQGADGSAGTMTMAMPKTKAPTVTRAQITAVGVLTLTALAAGVLLGAAFCSFLQLLDVTISYTYRQPQRSDLRNLEPGLPSALRLRAFRPVRHGREETSGCR